MGLGPCRLACLPAGRACERLPAGRACERPESLQTRAWWCDTRGAQRMQAAPLPATTALLSTPGLVTLGGSALMARFCRPCMRRACVGVPASPPLPPAAQQAGKGVHRQNWVYSPEGGWVGNEASAKYASIPPRAHAGTARQQLRNACVWHCA